MKTVTVSTRAKSINALLNQACQENLLLRSSRGREFILAEVDDFNREIELTRQNKKLMRFLERRARQMQTLSLEDAKKQLGLNGTSKGPQRKNSRRSD